jgi:GcrA cell cycle regulator
MMGFNWTPSAEDRLRVLADDPNVRVAEAADEFGISRNAIIGKTHRMGISFGQPPKVVRQKIVRPPRVRAERRFAERAFVLRCCVPEPNALNLTILDVKDSQCKWPTSIPEEEFGCCGQPAEESKPYCTHHCNMAYA